jgi:dTDP-4-dehydrorhamnose 3,5-epimerase
MKFTETAIPGAFVIELEPQLDERGFFSRSWCVDEYSRNGMNPLIMQCSVSYSWKKGTLRGMHYQKEPFAEAKTVRCTRGAVYDVILDMRRSSPAYKRWLGIELTAQNQRMLYVPEGVAHGFLTLADDTEMNYAVSQRYEPGSAATIRWDDPAFGIYWPEPVSVMSDKDRNSPLWREEEPC